MGVEPWWARAGYRIGSLMQPLQRAFKASDLKMRNTMTLLRPILNGDELVEQVRPKASRELDSMSPPPGGGQKRFLVDCLVRGQPGVGGLRFCGSKTPWAKLSERLVAQIRKSPESDEEWARRVGCHRRAIHSARTGQTWKHV